MAHNTTEVQYHPIIFKTKLCQNTTICAKGLNCHDAHGVNDLREGKKYYQFEVVPIKNENSGGSQNSSLHKPIKTKSVIEKAREKGVFVTIDLATFKTQACHVAGNHNPKKCPFYHENLKDKRRFIGLY